MDQQIYDSFKKIGARVRVTLARQNSVMGGRVPFTVNIRRDRNGSYFDLLQREDDKVEVLETRSWDRHLLLSVHSRELSEQQETRSAYLCGHDERSWFVAAIPESADAKDVQDAKDALKPQEVWDAMKELGVHPRERDRRRTAAFVRQGEWFFIPRPMVDVPDSEVLNDEPIRRGAGKPHRCQYLYRTDGEFVQVHPFYPNGLTHKEYRALPREQRQMQGWQGMVRDANVYVRGSVSHADHETIRLIGWHQVVMNTETKAAAMQHVAFLD